MSIIKQTKIVSISNIHAYVPDLAPWDAIDLSVIPASLKRRCSKNSKIALSLAAKIANEPIDYAVFCSQHGEISHTIALLDEIAKQSELSPMRFSQSVHNTASGLFTVANKLNIPVNSIANGKATFSAGLIDALCWLENNPERTVLFVIFDEGIPDIYKNREADYKQAYGLGFLLSNKNSQEKAITVNLIQSKSANTVEYKIPPALSFLDWAMNNINQQAYSQSQGSLTLKWERHHA